MWAILISNISGFQNNSFRLFEMDEEMLKVIQKNDERYACTSRPTQTPPLQPFSQGFPGDEAVLCSRTHTYLQTIPCSVDVGSGCLCAV